MTLLNAEPPNIDALANLVDEVGERKELEDGFWNLYIDEITGEFAKRNISDARRYRATWSEELSKRTEAAERLKRYMEAAKLVSANGKNFTATLVATDPFGTTHDVQITRRGEKIID
jgi:hypothetical protein